MIKNFQTYINEGLFDRNQSEFNIGKTSRGVEQVYMPTTKDELYEYIDLDIEQAKKDGTYPNVDLNNIDVSALGEDELKCLFGDHYPFGGIYNQINPDISNWNIKYIPSSFFYRNEQIKEFTIPDSVTSIEESAFHCCKCLTSVTIPNSVTSIGKEAFEDCWNLTSINIPESVTSIGSSAFVRCTSLTHVVIPNSVTSIGNDAFKACSLTSVTISKHCNIGDSYFPAFPKKCKIIRK